MIFPITPVMAADGARQEAAAYLAQGYESDYLISNFELSEEGWTAGDGVSVIQSQANPYEGKKSLSVAAQKVAPGKTITLHKSFDEAVNTEKYPYFAFGIYAAITADEGWTPNIPTEVELVFYTGSDTLSAKLTVPPSKWRAVAVDFSGLDEKKITAMDIIFGNNTINTTYSAALLVDRVAFSKEKPEEQPISPGMDFTELPDGVEEAAITTSQSLYPVSLIADFEKDTEGFAAAKTWRR